MAQISDSCNFKVGSKLGFIGVGVINSAIITGLCKISSSLNKINEHFSLPIFVSPRGHSRVASLLSEHGTQKIYVCKDNQEVLDKAGVIFIGVRPEQVI